jgi:hypothetical protein
MATAQESSSSRQMCYATGKRGTTAMIGEILFLQIMKITSSVLIVCNKRRGNLNMMSMLCMKTTMNMSDAMLDRESVSWQYVH